MSSKILRNFAPMKIKDVQKSLDEYEDEFKLNYC